MCNSNWSFTDNWCCWPEVVAVATVTVPFTLRRDPETLSITNSILWSSPPVVKTSLKYTFWELVLIPTVPIPVFSVANPIYSALNLVQKSLSKSARLKCPDKSTFFVALIVDPIDIILTSSPFSNLWFGKYIAFGGIDL